MTGKHGGTICVALAAFLAGVCVDHRRVVARAEGENRVFELRTYTAADGKLQPLLTRFREHSIVLLKKHGMPTVGFWVASDAPQSANTLVYVLAHESRQAADKSWKEFSNDPEWKAVVAESERNGRLITKVDRLYLNPTDFSPMK